MLSDEELVRRFISGEEKAFEELFLRYYPALKRFVSRTMSQQAEDIVQEAFLRVYRDIRRFSPDRGSFKTWIFSIAANLTVDEYRKKQRWLRIFRPLGKEALNLPDRSRSPDETLLEKERRSEIEKALQMLPIEQRQVLILKHLEGFKFKEIAQILGIPEGTVKSRMARGLKRLKEVLNEKTLKG
ncbi:sigma-70 family RNA polymerase sigma factor [Candidatus Poribacteria bacterium]|nr:sigma-70 family RNA polymerase sigma factor [Candidatus Poribacteria bacterium]